jgi:hypothetical protein
MSDIGIINKMQIILNDASETYSRCCPIVCLVGLSKTTKTLSQDSRCPTKIWTDSPTEYKSRALPPDEIIMRITLARNMTLNFQMRLQKLFSPLALLQVWVTQQMHIKF